jgi:hypothetical protein
MKAAKDQGDKGLEFNGQGSPVSYKGGEQYSGNRSGLVGKANYGMGPRRGNDGSCDVPISGPSATRDPVKKTISTAAGGGVTGRGTVCRSPANPDKIRY